MGWLIIIFVLCLIFHIYTDYKEMLLYNWINGIIALSGMLYAYLSNNAIEAILGFVTAFVIMLIIFVASRGELGKGDVNLAACLGIWLGFDKTLLALLLAFMIGVIIGLPFMLIKRIKLDTAIPFGPFLSVGALLSFFYDKQVITIWSSFI